MIEANSETVTWRCCIKSVFLKASKNPHENTFGRVFALDNLLIRLQAKSLNTLEG